MTNPAHLTSRFHALVSYAALSPVHVMVLPKAPRRNLVGMTDAEQLAQRLRGLL